MEILKTNEIVINDDLVKKGIGKRVLAYRKYSMNCSREQFTKVFDCGDSTLINVERGKCFPDLIFISKLANYSSKSVNSFVTGKDFAINVESEDMRLLERSNDKQKITILMKCLCEKNDMLHMYDRDIVNMIFDERDRFNTKVIGYLINFEREKRNISRKKLAEAINFLEKSLNNLEYGNSTVSFKALYHISEYMGVPLDFFLMGYLKDKKNIIDYLMSDLFSNTNEYDKRFIRCYLEESKLWMLAGK